MPTASNENRERIRFAQAGFVMKAYRESFPRDDGGRGISQNDLLVRMASADSTYSRRLSHATVSRWESGDTPPTVERLLIFGKALNLSEVEIEGLITLAGLDPQRQVLRTLPCPHCAGETQATDTKMFRKTFEGKTVTTTAIRTRRCLACGHAAESCERWTDNTEETANRKTQNILNLVETASEKLRQALTEAETL